MVKILIHCHIYYPDLWIELKHCLHNISSYPSTLFVTMVKAHQEIIDDIKNNFPSAKVEIIKNRGYDVGPFVHVLNQVDLSEYDYVIKIHTKRDIALGMLLNDFNVSGAKWRQYMLEMVNTSQNLEKSLNAFTKDEKLGMVTNYRLIIKSQDDHKECSKFATEYLKSHDYNIKEYRFAAGTMFMVRAKLLEPLKQLNLSLNDFEIPEDSHQKLNLAHIIERVIGALVYQQGYQINDVFSSSRRLAKVIRLWYKLLHFVYRRKTTATGKTIIKICKVPLINMTIKSSNHFKSIIKEN